MMMFSPCLYPSDTEEKFLPCLLESDVLVDLERKHDQELQAVREKKLGPSTIGLDDAQAKKAALGTGRVPPSPYFLPSRRLESSRSRGAPAHVASQSVAEADDDASVSDDISISD